LLVLIFSCSVISPCVSGINAPNAMIASTGMITYSATTIRRMLWDGGLLFPPIQTYAEKADMYMNGFTQAYKIPQIHAQNPNVICLLYRNARAIYTSSAEYQMFVDNGWLLKDPNGAFIYSTVFPSQRMVDEGNPDYQQWVANWLKGYLDQYGYDGVFLDDCVPSTETLWGTSPTPAINPRTGQPWTDQEFKEAVIALVNKVKDTIGSRLVVCNGIWHGERFFGYRNQLYIEWLTQSKIDGVESEAWLMDRDEKVWYSESKWKKSIDFAVWLENNFLNESGKVFTPVCQNVAPYNKQGESLPANTTKQQYALYCFASLLLAASSDSHYLNFGYYVDDYVDSLFKIELGSPLNNYYIIDGTHVYARDFSTVKVLVNPTDQSYSVNLSGNYETFDGTPVTSPMTLAPHTGMILRRL